MSITDGVRMMLLAPTFTEDELKVAVQVAKSSGRIVAVHSGTEEGMRRAILAGVTTIEHGDGGTHLYYLS